jgi:hypothetical protein
MTKLIVSAFASLLIASPSFAAPFEPATRGGPGGRGGASRMVGEDYQPPDVGGPGRTVGTGTR